jgi:hypothetical protein
MHSAWGSSRQHPPQGVDKEQRIIACIVVKIVKLRITQTLRFDVERIRLHEPPHAAAIVPGPKVIQSGFAVPFFAGELVAGCFVHGEGASYIKIIKS